MYNSKDFSQLTKFCNHATLDHFNILFRIPVPISIYPISLPPKPQLTRNLPLWIWFCCCCLFVCLFVCFLIPRASCDQNYWTHSCLASLARLGIFTLHPCSTMCQCGIHSITEWYSIAQLYHTLFIHIPLKHSSHLLFLVTLLVLVSM